MEQGIVTNTSEEEVDVMWDGQHHYFEPGQKRVFSIGIAQALAGESEALSLERGEVMPEGTEVVEPAAPETEDEELVALRAEAEALGIKPGRRPKALLKAVIAKVKKG